LLYKFFYYFLLIFFSLFLHSATPILSEQLLFNLAKFLNMKIEACYWHYKGYVCKRDLNNLCNFSPVIFPYTLKLNGGIIAFYCLQNFKKKYLSISAEGKPFLNEDFRFRSFRNLFSKYNLSYDFSLQGFVSCRTYGFKELKQKILKFLHASQVEETADKSVSSFSCKSPLFPCNIKTGDKEINFQFAIKKYSEGDYFIVTFGIPLITIEY